MRADKGASEEARRAGGRPWSAAIGDSMGWSAGEVPDADGRTDLCCLYSFLCLLCLIQCPDNDIMSPDSPHRLSNTYHKYRTAPHWPVIIRSRGAAWSSVSASSAIIHHLLFSSTLLLFFSSSPSLSSSFHLSFIGPTLSAIKTVALFSLLSI